MKHQVTCF